VKTRSIQEEDSEQEAEVVEQPKRDLIVKTKTLEIVTTTQE
jgi:hypothetical protein